MAIFLVFLSLQKRWGEGACVGLWKEGRKLEYFLAEVMGHDFRPGLRLRLENTKVQLESQV